MAARERLNAFEFLPLTSHCQPIRSVRGRAVSQSGLSERYLNAAGRRVVIQLKPTVTDLLGNLSWSLKKSPYRFFKFSLLLTLSMSSVEVHAVVSKPRLLCCLWRGCSCSASLAGIGVASKHSGPAVSFVSCVSLLLCNPHFTSNCFLHPHLNVRFYFHLFT